MPPIDDEIDANQIAFFANWTDQATKNWKTLKDETALRLSYRRLCSLQAIKTDIIIPTYSPDSAAFFFEAHNDSLVSHVAATFGAWRSAHHALRSCMENVLCSIYYKDHPVELELWTKGKFRLGFSALTEYLRGHPKLMSLDENLTGIPMLKNEYAVLSQAVHGSAVNFRMTDEISSVLLWSTDHVKLGIWSTREKRVFEALCLLLICLHSESLVGARLRNLRSMLYYAIRPGRRDDIQRSLHITIPNPND